MGDKPSIEALANRVKDAQEKHRICAQVSGDARREETAALNAVNAAQKEFDKAISDFKATAPQNSDWKRAVDPCRGDWLQTYTGLAFYPLDPRTDDVRIEDIAHALARLCRYGGHCIRFYSVAEHCVLMAEKAPDELKLATLMHDAAEAYLVDVPRPAKAALRDYANLEASIERVIFQRFNIPFPLPAEIKALDNAIIADEREQNMNPPPQPWKHSAGLGVTLRFWDPPRAAYEFELAFHRYGGHFC